MKINKVGQATSSVVKLAQVQSSNRLLGKVSITKNNLRPEIQNTAGAIIKRAETIRSTIDHIIYLSGQTGEQTYFDYLLPADSIFLYFYKERFVDDVLSILDDLPEFLIGKSVADQADFADRITLTVQTLRLIQEQQSLNSEISLLAIKALADTVTPQEEPAFRVSLSKTDQTLIAEIVDLLVMAQRTFHELVTNTDRRTFTVGKGLADTATPVQRIFKNVSNQRVDEIAIASLPSIGPNKRFFDSLGVAQTAQSLVPGKGIFSTTRVTESLTRIFDAQRVFADQPVANDDFIAAFAATRRFADTATLADLFVFTLLKRFTFEHTLTLTDDRYFYVGKQLVSAQIMDQRIFLQPNKLLQSQAQATDDPVFFNIIKSFADAANLSDLSDVFDGLNYSTSMYRQDSTAPLDVLTRRTVTKRRFELLQEIADLPSIGPNKQFYHAVDAPTDERTFYFIKGPSDFPVIGSGLGRRESSLEKVTFNITMPFTTRTVTTYNETIDGIREPVANLTSGTTFTGSAIFSSNSVTSDVAVVESGDGISSFITPAVEYGFGGYNDLPASGSYIKFAGLGSRWIKTVPLNLTTAATVKFLYIAGNNTNGGDRPETNENLIFEYSITGGANFVTSAVIWAGNKVYTSGSTWSTTSIAIPAAAKTASTILRWRQTGNPVISGDNYGLMHITIANGADPIKIFNAPFYDDHDAHINDDVIRAHTGIRDYSETIDFNNPAWVSSVGSSAFIAAMASSTVTSALQGFIHYTNSASTVLFGTTYNNKFYRSIDAGVTWSSVSVTSFTQYYVMASNTTGSMTVAMNSLGSNNLYSTDQGLTWSSIATLGGSTQISHVAYDKIRNSFAGTYTVQQFVPGPNYYLYYLISVYSADGISWSVGPTIRGPAFPGAGQYGYSQWLIHANDIATPALVTINQAGEVYMQSSTAGLASSWALTATLSGVASYRSAAAGNGKLVALIGTTAWRSTDLYNWYSSTVTTGTFDSDLVFDPSTSWFISPVVSTTPNVVYYSDDAITWQSSTLTGTTAQNSSVAASFYYDVVPNSLPVSPYQAGSSVTIGGIFSTTSSTTVLRLYMGYEGSGIQLYAEPRGYGEDQKITTTFDVSKTAKAGTTRTVSSTTVMADDSDRLFIGQQYTGEYRAGDGLERIYINAQPYKYDFLTAEDNEALLLPHLGKFDSVVVEVPTNWSGYVTSTEIVTVTSSYTIITDGYLSSVSTGSSMSGSKMFSSSMPYSAGTYVVDAGTGSGSTGGFPTYRHVEFNTVVGGRGLQTRKLDLSTANAVTFKAIAGSGSNGGAFHAVSLSVFYRVGTGGYNLMLTIPPSGCYSWTDVTINLDAGAKTSNVDLLWYDPSPAGTQREWGVTNVRIDSSAPVVITYDTSYTTSITTLTPDRPPRSTAETQTFEFLKTAKQSVNNTVSGITVTASDLDRLFVGQRYGGVRFSGDPYEVTIFDIAKPIDSSVNIVTMADLFSSNTTFVRGPAFTQEDVPILGEREGNFSYALTQGVKYEDLLATDDIIVSNLLFRSFGTLDTDGDINTTSNYGYLRMESYVDDIDYLAEDYIGEFRWFTN